MTSWTLYCSMCGTFAGTYNERFEEPPSHRHRYTGNHLAITVVYEAVKPTYEGKS